MAPANADFWSLRQIRSLKIRVCDRSRLIDCFTAIDEVKVNLRVQARIFGECRLHPIQARPRGRRLLGVIWSSEEAHTVDALAVRGDERRGSLR